MQALSRLILAPVSASLKKKRLVVVAEGALQYIPFGALPEASGEPLIVRHEIVGIAFRFDALAVGDARPPAVQRRQAADRVRRPRL